MIRFDEQCDLNIPSLPLLLPLSLPQNSLSLQSLIERGFHKCLSELGCLRRASEGQPLNENLYSTGLGGSQPEGRMRLADECGPCTFL
jgi:hypothetical protein